jgi:DNA-binding IclR family transcriptional regulator
LDYTVAAVDEAAGLLFLVAREPGLGLSELAKKSGNTKTRSFRLLTTLEQRSLVKRQGEPSRYYLSFAALSLGAAAQQQIDLVRVVREPLNALVDILGETAMVRVRDGLETLCVARHEHPQALIRVGSEIGHRRPLHVGASGKLLLAHASTDVINDMLRASLPSYTENTLVNPDALDAELSLIRDQGYAVSRAELVAELASVAVPIRDLSGDVIAALTMSTLLARMTEDRLPRYLAELRKQAAAISGALGYRGNDHR